MKSFEKMREKSKIAARTRRVRENAILNNLSVALPIEESSKQSLDKPSILRLTLCYLRLNKFMGEGKQIKSYFNY
jgi:single-minded-like protein